jgi:hypothetical protein
MRLFLVAILAAGAFAILPMIGGPGLEEERVTVIHKNLESPTLEELGQKAGDPSQAEAPEEPILNSPRKAQWI